MRSLLKRYTIYNNVKDKYNQRMYVFYVSIFQPIERKNMKSPI